MNYFIKTLVFGFFVAINFVSNAQGPKEFDCPQFPSYGFFDRGCLIKTAAPYGEIRLSQAGVDGLNEERPMYLSIPTNRPTWAIGIAHAWNYNRNMIGRVDHPKISYWLAITGHETGLACDCGAEWNNGRTPWTSRGNNFPPKCAEGLTQHDGCFQMEEANAWCGDLNQTWPWRFQPGKHQDYISKGNFETAALGLAYRNILNHFLIDYSWGIDIWPVIEQTADKNAYEKLMASGWNSWAAAVQQNVSGTAGAGQGFNLYTTAGRNAAIASCEWDLTATSSRYPEVIGWSMSVLENNTAACNYQYENPIVTSVPGAQQKHEYYGYYNENITWQNVQDYLNKMYAFYSELSAAHRANTTLNVQNAFVSIAGSTAGVIPFQKLGPVVDEIILGLPKENPMMSVIHNDGLPAYNNGYRQCIGDYAPASHIVNKSPSDTVCVSQAYVLEAMIDGGDGPNLTYSWQVNGVAVPGGNTKELVVMPNTPGSYIYTLNVCNPALGGCAPADCHYEIVVKSCVSCGIMGFATTTNTPCQNMKGGSITLNVLGSSNFIVNYTSKNYSGTQEGFGSSITISDVPDGLYDIVMYDKSIPNCKYALSAEVKATVAQSDELIASIKSMTSCDAVLQTELKKEDCECEWSVYFDTPYAAWERDVFVIITPSNGSSIRLRKDVLINAYPAPTKATFKLCSGEHIKFEVEVQPSSGSCTGAAAFNEQNAPIEVYIKNPQGVEVLRKLIPIKSAKQYENFLAFDYVVDCPYTPGNYTYLWNPGNLTGNTVNVSGQSPTIYTVVATNVAYPQCTLSDTVLVPFSCKKCVAPKATISGNTNICAGDSTQLTVNLTGKAPWKLKISNGSSSNLVQNILSSPYQFYVKTSGTFKVDTVWDATCDTLGTGSVAVQINPKPVLNFSSDTVSFCSGGSIVLNPIVTAPVGTEKYLWSGLGSGTSSTFLAKTKGWYSVEVSSIANCKAKDSVYVIEASNLKVSLVDSAVCSGDSLVLNAGYAIPAYNVNWSTGAKTSSITIKNAGTYSVTVDDGKGCTGTDQMTLSLHNRPQITLGKDSSFCEGNSLNLTVNGGLVSYTYLWNTGETKAQLLVKSEGKYMVEVTDLNSCTSRDTINIIARKNPSPNVLSNDTVCLSASKILDVSGYTNSSAPFNYLWSDGSKNSALTLNNLSSDKNVWVEITDRFSCKGRDSAFIKVLNYLPVIISVDGDSVLCEGESTILSTNFSNQSGYNILWNSLKSSPNLTVDSAGIYQVEVTDPNGCKGNDNINIIVNPLPNLTSISDSISFCEGNKVTIGKNLGSGYTYLWKGMASTQAQILVSEAGNYQVLVNDGNCADSVIINVQVNDLPKISLGADKIACEGEFITLQPNLNELTWKYLWNNSITKSTFQATETGVYFLKVTDENNCQYVDSVLVNFVKPPFLDLEAGKDTLFLCEGESYNLSAGQFSSEYSILWSTGASTNSIQLNNKGTISVIVSNGTCISQDKIEVEQISLPKYVLGDSVGILTQSYCLEEHGRIHLSANPNGIKGLSYLWNTGETSSSLTTISEGLYTVEISKEGCSVESSIKIVDYCPYSIFIPNAFSPNEDGLNEEFKAFGKHLEKFELTIFNRWGEPIFKSSDMNQGWNGLYLNGPAQMDVYVYKLNYSYREESGRIKENTQTGTVSLIR